MSPLKTAGRERFKRGLIVHRLLQSLPELPEAAREAAAGRFLALPTHMLPADEQDDIRRETLTVLNHPDFAAIFGPRSQAEVPLVGLIGGHALSGQIDRLVVEDDRVLIVDYKTMRPVPPSEDEVAPRLSSPARDLSRSAGADLSRARHPLRVAVDPSAAVDAYQP